MNKLFCDSGGVNYIVAESADEAVTLYLKTTGETLEGIEELLPFEETLYSLDKVFTIYDELTDTKEAHSLKEWIDINGKGYLFSTEW